MGARPVGMFAYEPCCSIAAFVFAVFRHTIPYLLLWTAFSPLRTTHLDTHVQLTGTWRHLHAACMPELCEAGKILLLLPCPEQTWRDKADVSEVASPIDIQAIPRVACHIV